MTFLCRSVLFLLVSATAVTTAPGADRPNIVIIYTDDHAQHAVSAYGSRINKTPEIDRLAAEGLRFRQSFVGNSICGPARATLITGLQLACERPDFEPREVP